MNTQQLECFVTLTKNLNYAKTAEDLCLSQPAVSRQIQSLEAELNTKLFNRTTRSVSLTQVGFQFLADAQQMLSIYYHSLEWISTFHKHKRTVLRIGYADSHANRLISKILSGVLAERDNIVPELTLDQTDANLHRLAVSQLDLVVGMKDAKFTADDIAFQKLHDDGFVCVVHKNHPLAQTCKKRRQKSVSSKIFWPYRQIIDIPPYLLKHVFSRGHRIVPVNDELDNIVCSTTSEAYNLTLAGVGFSLIPEHLALPNKELVFLPWEESPRAPMGIYYHKQAAVDKNSAIYRWICVAKNCIEEAMPWR
ncbi:LysR family transcriptional regulator [Mitsuokella sp.]